MRKKLTYGLLIAGSSLLSPPSLAAFIMNGKAAGNDSPLINSTDPGAERFRGVGKLFAATHCTATLFSGEKTPERNSPALVITAGHCVESNMGTNQVIVDQAAPKEWKYIPDYFVDTHDNSHPVTVRRTLFATMKQVDLAVLQLDKTYGELEQQGLFPLKLKKDIQAHNQPIELAHIPVMGVDENEQYLRHSLCHIKGQTPVLFESNTPWVWGTAYPVDCAGVAGGTSGSPVVEHEQSRIIGILNTTVTPGLTGCGVGRPCEVHNNQPYVNEGASYFIPVDQVAMAITDDGKLDLSKLESNGTDILKRNGSWVTKSQVNGHDSTWNITINDIVNHIRYKAGLANETDCTDITGYGNSIATITQPLSNLVISKKEGVYLLCVIHQDENGNWTPSSYAFHTIHVIDDTPPKLKPEIEVEEKDDLWVVSPVSMPWELGEPWLKYGPLSSTDCEDKVGYKYYLMPARLSKSSSPWRFCTYGTDQAGNAGPVNKMDFETSSIKVENDRVVAAWNHPLPKDEFLRRVGATTSAGVVFIDMPDDKYFDLYRLPGKYLISLKAGKSTTKVTLDVLKDYIPPVTY